MLNEYNWYHTDVIAAIIGVRAEFVKGIYQTYMVFGSEQCSSPNWSWGRIQRRQLV